MKTWGRKAPATISSVRRELIEDSIERKRLVDRLVQLVREDERARVLSVTERARERAGER